MFQSSLQLRSILRTTQNLRFIKINLNLLVNKNKCAVCYGQEYHKNYTYRKRDILKRDNNNKSDEASNDNISKIFKPVEIPANSADDNIGEDFTGPLNKLEILKVLEKFYHDKQIRDIFASEGLDRGTLHEAYTSFRKYCMDTASLPVELHLLISDILQGAYSHVDILPYFRSHMKRVFPHLDCMEVLKKISDLTTPPQWYDGARKMKRKIIFHTGPTNSGKTYHAMKRFLESNTGIYCGPLKLLASEVFNKSNNQETPCDLVTGEEKKYADPDHNPAAHLACTVEMTNLLNKYEIAIIDEIQMIQDPGRGWAWTRALLGVQADEIHLCGEEGAVDLVQQICATMEEEVEIRKYARLTTLKTEDTALGSLRNVQPGDCVVCFSKNDIYHVSKTIEETGKEVAVIYGSLPPNTKLLQAAKFNDPESNCGVLVATDAIGMGLNLSIRRIIFYSLIKPVVNEKNELDMSTISVSQALQIAGRAGRFGTQWEEGLVTTYREADLPILKDLLAQKPEPIKKAGLHPTADQIELYAYHLPHSTLSNLMDIFVKLSTVDDSLYFMCNTEDFKILAEEIQHIPLPLKARYMFCCAPINRKLLFARKMFIEFAQRYSKSEPITFKWLCGKVGWPLQPPKTIVDLMELEATFDVLDLYLWLSYRFEDLFPEPDLVRGMERKLDVIIEQGMLQITRLLKNSENSLAPDMSTIFQDDELGSNRNENESNTSGKKRITEQLLAEGSLTPEMLQELKKEFYRDLFNDSSSKNRRKFRRLTKK